MAIEKKIKCGYEVYEIIEEKTNSRAVICPERGGILLELELNGEKIFYLDEETFADATKNIRGGNPVLFPICGPLENNECTVDGIKIALKQHGFVRNMKWEVEGSDAQSITLSIQDTDQTFEQYPFEFLLTFTYTLEDGKMQIHQQYENHSDSVMPFYAGFHPYFVGNHAKTSYEIPSEKFTNSDRIEFQKYTGNLADLDIGVSKIFVELDDRRVAFGEDENKVVLTYSDDFPAVVVWSEKAEAYICVEPWMALPGAFNNSDSFVKLAPGNAKISTLTIAME